MTVAVDVSEYLAEIRSQVCSRCVERPPGGPPCEPLGKFCGVERHLPELVESIHAVQSDLLGPYLLHNRLQICEHCALYHSDICPCPMDYLLALIIQAVETVDRRHAAVNPPRQEPEPLPLGWDDIYQAYEEGVGTWTGCDWPTRVGKTGLDLNGCTATRAEALARELAGTTEGMDWQVAAAWLGQIERYAEQAEKSAFQAMNAARAGNWREALEHAQRAWALEFASGRPMWREFTPAWQKLHLIAEKVYLAPPPKPVSAS